MYFLVLYILYFYTNLENRSVQTSINQSRVYYKIVALESELRSCLHHLLIRLSICTLYYMHYVTTIVLRIYDHELIQKGKCTFIFTILFTQ
jgi:hypothetical protein